MHERLSKTGEFTIQVTMDKLNERFEAEGYAKQVKELMETEEFKIFFSEKLLNPLKDIVEHARSFLNDNLVKDYCDSEFMREYCYNNLLFNMYYAAVDAYLDNEASIEEGIQKQICMDLLKTMVQDLYQELSNKVLSILIAKELENRMRAYGLIEDDDEAENPVS